MSLVFERLRTALAPGIELERELASGGMGDIYVGRDTVLDRRVAIKVLKPEYATAVAAERFMREAQSAARLSHPNVVRVYHPDTADGFLYFTMEMIAGETLNTRLTRGPLSAAETAALGRDVLAALGAAHAQSIIHRDVKPSNIFLDDGRAKLGDFGIARVLETTDPTLTTPGKPIGTPTYMSPEQSRGEPVTPASDIYSAGLVLFESLTGRRWPAGLPPDEGDWSDVPGGLRRALKRALQVAPTKRWPDAGSFAEALPVGRGKWGPVVMAALGLAAIVYLAIRFWPSPPPRYDLSLFPFETAGLADTTVGRSVTRATEWYFRRLPSLSLEPRASATQRWLGSSLPPAKRLTELTTAAHARFGAWGLVRSGGAILEVDVSVVNDRGEPVLHAVIEGDPADHVALGDRVGERIVGAMTPPVRHDK